MKYGKSLYRGGEIIDAENCSYDSFSRLGVVCPFCSEAVFFRREHLRRDKLVPASWCHYKNDDPIADDCELRSSRPDGQAYIQRLQNEARQQRLEIFNKRFWDIIAVSHGFSTKTLKGKIQKCFGSDWLKWALLNSRKDLRANVEAYWHCANEVFDVLLSPSSLANASPVSLANSNNQVPGIYSALQKLGKGDRALHKVIVGEALDFLSTKTGGYAYERLFHLVLYEECSVLWDSLGVGDGGDASLAAFSHQVKMYGSQFYNHEIAKVIGTAFWIENFYSLEDDEALLSHAQS